MNTAPSSVVHKVVVSDERGNVIGTEDRVFFFAEQPGRGVALVAESDAPPTPEDAALVELFCKKASSGDGLGAVLALAPLDATHFARFRTSFRARIGQPDLTAFVRSHIKGGLANWCLALLCHPAELCADECHLATMGLSDNSGAVVDVLCGRATALATVNLFYGVKFGDSRYEVKSKDGMGDADKLRKDVVADARGARAKELLAAVITHSIGHDSAHVAPQWSDALVTADAGAVAAFLLHATPAERAKGAAPLQATAGDDALLARALHALATERVPYWTERFETALRGPKADKKLLMRVACVLSPQG